jgi:hypothetical protein
MSRRKSWLVFLCAFAIGVVACADRDGIKPERVPRQAVLEKNERVIEARGIYTRAPDPPNFHSECEPGQRQSCGFNLPGYTDAMGMHVGRKIYMSCQCWPGGGCYFNRSACATPLVLAFGDDKITFTRPAGSFTIGPYARTEWVSATTPWLALDRDGSGCIESQNELFGPPDDGTTGFEKLARLDENHDGRIDENDPAFAKLVTWSDANGDRRCTPSEVKPLRELGVVAIELDYRTLTSHTPGSYEGEQATIWYRTTEGDTIRRGRIVDVHLAPLP